MKSSELEFLPTYGLPDGSLWVPQEGDIDKLVGTDKTVADSPDPFGASSAAVTPVAGSSRGTVKRTKGGSKAGPSTRRSEIESLDMDFGS